MTTFRAVGESSADSGTTRGGLPVYTCVVRFLELCDRPLAQRELFMRTFSATTAEDLAAQCAGVLDSLKATHEATYRALDITRRTIAEVTSDLPAGDRTELVVKTTGTRT